MSRVLVTGASGLLGSHLAKALAGREAHALGRSDPGAPYRWIRADLEQAVDLALLPKAVDAVAYLAQSARFREIPERAGEVFAVNVLNVMRLLQWAADAGARTFVLASSGGLYAPAERPLREDDPVEPAGPLAYYLGTKRCAELLAQAGAARMSIVVLRFFFIYGAGQGRGMLLPRLVDNVRAGRPIDLQGEDGMRINPVHASDAAAAVAAALDLRQGAVFNVAGPEALTMRAIGETIGAKVGRAPIFKVDGARAPAHMVADTNRMRELLVAPRVRFAEGIGLLLGDGDA